MTDECQQCGLPDLHDGDGDGIGSCDCVRCDECGAPTLTCRCADDGYDDPYDWRPVETIQPAGGLL